MDYDEIWTFILSLTIFTSLTTMLAACLCCRKRVPKSSNAPHRSLPDIPASDQAAVDTNSDLYATVGDKVQGRPQGRSPSSLKKQSVSQHSSLSQADDVSSPYASVRSPSHAYDKIRKTEHPYAQLQPNQVNPPPDHNGLSRRASNESLLGTNEPTGADIPAASAIAGRISASQELPYMTPPIAQPQHFSGDSQDSSKGYTSISVREPLANILAQTNKQNAQTRRRDLSDSHYATVSDDSDEMYAAIDDPNNPADLYTSGSETYAQIQPPNAMVVSVEINTPSNVRNNDSIDQVAEVTTPQQNIDIPAPSLVDNFRAQATVHSRQASSSSVTSSIGILGSPKPEKRQANSPLPPTPKSGKIVAHYSSSNSNLTSTSSTQSGRNSVASVVDTHQLLETKGDALHPGDDDVSVSKCKKSPSKDLEGMYAKVMKKNKLSNLPSQNSSPQMSRKFPGDRASTAEPEVFISDSDISNGTPVPDSGRASVHESPGKYSVRSAGQADNNYETIERKLSRGRSSSYGEKDPGYETIPGDKRDAVDGQSRASAPPGLIAPVEVLQKADFASSNVFHYNQAMEDPGYEIVKQRGISTSDDDPNYEVLRPTDVRDEDGYSRIWDKGGVKRVNRLSGGDLLDGYSSIKTPRGEKSGNETETDSDVPGYTSIREVKKLSSKTLDDVEPGYSIICDKTAEHQTKKLNTSINNNNNNNILDDSDIYSSIPHSENPSYLSIQDNVHNYSTIGETPSSSQTLVSSPGYSSISDTLTATTTPSSESMGSDQLLYRSHMQTTSSNYESLTGSESDPNYETVRYLGVKENPYERLHNEKASSPECQSEKRPSDSGGGGGGGNHISGNGPIPTSAEGQEVSDYFQV
ncbi:uncharacterized protein LOC132257141 isoform X2 [Phlebotomus argentipes]|uniref:uncharacterized protein LOC132257141 isoform X2 n=1 Tax=Phlebotomus argentipes TaxID=94469 RepID=UPI002892E670|nr:uncharacterized protein LOC132257141 isoform X2 [Phlebotomus argentipes]